MSWEQLIGILEEASSFRVDEVLVDCPNDGTTLEVGPDGVLFCPWDGWRQG